MHEQREYRPQDGGLVDPAREKTDLTRLLESVEQAGKLAALVETRIDELRLRLYGQKDQEQPNPLSRSKTEPWHDYGDGAIAQLGLGVEAFRQRLERIHEGLERIGRL